MLVLVQHISLGGVEVTPGQVQHRAHWVRWKAAFSQSVIQGYKERKRETFEFSLKQSPSLELKPDSNAFSSRLRYLS